MDKERRKNECLSFHEQGLEWAGEEEGNHELCEL